MGTGPFRPARTQAGGGSGAYDIPPSPDGSYNGPGSATYAWIQQNYTPELWNSIPPDSKPIILGNAIRQSSANSLPGIGGDYFNPGNRARHNMATRDMDRIYSFLGDLAASQHEGQLAGLFGGGDGTPSTPIDIRRVGTGSGNMPANTYPMVPPGWTPPPTPELIPSQYKLRQDGLAPALSKSLIEGFLNGRQ